MTRRRQDDRLDTEQHVAAPDDEADAADLNAEEQAVLSELLRQIGPFACIVMGNKGGVGKSTVACLVWAVFEELGLTPKLGEIEGADEARLSKVLARARVAPAVTARVPSMTELASNPRVGARLFAAVLSALAKPAWPTIIDCGSTIGTNFLAAADLSGHGQEIEDGAYLRVVVVAKGGDMISAMSAASSIRDAGAVYPKARIVLVVTHVEPDPDPAKETDNAEVVIKAIKADYPNIGVVKIPLFSNLLMTAYSKDHIALHLLAEMAVGELGGVIGVSDPYETRQYLASAHAWYDVVLSDLARELKITPKPRPRGRASRLQSRGTSARGPFA